MQRISLILIMLLVNIALLAQEPQLLFTYKLLPTSDPANVSNVKFVSHLPENATSISWTFGDGGTSNLLHPEKTYTVTTIKEFTVILSYSIDGQTLTYEQVINVNPAFFRVGLDLNLGELATLKRIFRSAFMFQTNHPDSIGDMRFYWEIDGVRPTGNAFTGDMGDFPSIYHTFPQGGNHAIVLRVYNTLAPLTNYAEYSLGINLLPPVTTSKLDFVNLPEYVTPNGDNVNDYFEVIATGTTSLSFMVFSRSGSVVYQQEANIIKWDGTNYYGKELPEGIYYYTIEDNGNLYNPAKGFFYIFRGKK